MTFTNIQLYGIDTDGCTTWYDAWEGTAYNSGETPTDDERKELIDNGWDGTTLPWIIPDE